MVGTAVLDDDVPPRHGDGRQQGGGHDPVGDDAMGAGRGVELFDAVDLDVRRPRAADPGSHVGQEVGEVRDLGLTCRVLDHRGPFGEDRRHEDVVGGGVARVLEDHALADEATFGTPGHATLDVAVHRLEHRTQGRQAVEVDVDGAVPEVVATGERHAGPSRARQQRPEDDHRGPHLLDELVRRLGDEGRGRVDDEVSGPPVGPVGPALDLRADGLEDLGHDLHVDDARHAGEDVAALRQEARRHQLESGVLGAAGGHRPVQGTAGTDDESVHRARPDQTTGFSAHRPKTDPRAPTISPTVA